MLLTRGLLAIGAVLAVAWAPAASAENFNLGPDACQNCHKGEYEVWSKTKHAMSFKDFHRDKKALDILKVTGERSVKQSKVCTECHYTTAQKDASAKADQVAGPSCESCHGPASAFIKIHNDYGGPGIKKEDEKPDHKAKRLADAKAAGMRRPEGEGKFDVVEQCYFCHGLGRKELDGKILGSMIDAGHPTNDEFEFVRYSQGQVRHNFWPPKITENQQMTPQQLAEWFAIGQAAALVESTQGANKTDNAKYKAADAARISKAKDVLSKIPEAKTLLGAPTPENGRAFAAAISGKDLTKVVGPMLPDPKTYK